MAQILVVDDQPDLRERLIQVVSTFGEVTPADNRDKAIELIRDTEVDVVVTDLRLNLYDPADTGGLDILKAAHKKDKLIPVIVVTAVGNIESNSQAMSLEAFDYIERNNRRIDFEKVLLRKIRIAIEYRDSRRMVEILGRPQAKGLS
jgi:DNA-binding NtrC family response regulator